MPHSYIFEMGDATRLGQYMEGAGKENTSIYTNGTIDYYR
jgi:hypothetical protein